MPIVKKTPHEEIFLRRLPFWVVVFGIFMMFIGINQNFRPIVFHIPIKAIGMILLIGCFFATFLLGFIRREYFVYRWMILPLFCVISFASLAYLPKVGLKIRDFEFRKRIDDYVSVVNEIRDGKIPYSNVFRTVDKKYLKRLPPTVFYVWVDRCKDNGVVVGFDTSTRPHTGFIYIDNGPTGNCKDMVPKSISLKPIFGNWYSYSN